MPAASTGCARRCGAIRPTATRISSSAPRWPRRATPPRPRARRSWRARLSSTYEEWEKRPAGGAGPQRPRARQENEVELPHAQTDRRRGSPRRRSAISRSWRRSISIAARRLFQQENDREAIAELDRALYLSPYLADAHLLLGRIHLRNGRVRDAIDALKISLWSARNGRGAYGRWPRRTRRPRTRSRRVRKPNARWPSIRRLSEAQDGSSTC